MHAAHLIPPHGGVLVNRVLTPDAAKVWAERAQTLPKLQLDVELIKDIKNIARGVMSPLTGFMNEADFVRVVDEMHLASGDVWSIPFVLDVTKEESMQLKTGDPVALCDAAGNAVAVLHVGDVYTYDVMHVVEKVYGTTDDAHPGVSRWKAMKPYLVGGTIDLIDNSKEPFYEVNLDPVETRYVFTQRGWKTIVGFQTRNAPHRAHEYLQRLGLELCDGLFINPIIGKKKAGDFQDEVIIASYSHMMKEYFPSNRAVFSILPARMNYAGPRDAIYHAILRKNFGCSHFVVGRDHAGVGTYYGTFAAQEIFDTIEDIGIKILKFENGFFCTKCDCMATPKTCAHSDDVRVPPSGTKIRKMLTAGEVVPPTIMRTDVVELILKQPKIFVEEGEE
ncbi:MAG: sulfate adenylyltransferase [Candidatus Kerfeldbacteria bacterium]|nr:sulfate adenylyltransferase [Candidatus Kerfeldbacteria bacterium]